MPEFTNDTTLKIGSKIKTELTKILEDFGASIDPHAYADGDYDTAIKSLLCRLGPKYTQALNYAAIKKYNEAQLISGPANVGKKQAKIREGIATFPSLDLALEDAQINIKRFTKSDFNSAWFYEAVSTEINALKESL